MPFSNPSPTDLPMLINTFEGELMLRFVFAAAVTWLAIDRAAATAFEVPALMPAAKPEATYEPAL